MKRRYRNDVSQARLKTLCLYEQKTGIFYWLDRSEKEPGFRRFNTRYAGKIAGRKGAKGYIAIRIDGVSYAAHRLAWLYVYGVFPRYEIDHINRQRDDNRLANLRDVTSSENNNNKGASQLWGKGVCFDKSSQKFMAYAARKTLGRFNTEVEAMKARSRFVADY